MAVQISFSPARLSPAGGLTLAAARELLYRWLWWRKQGERVSLAAGNTQVAWHEEAQWLGLEMKEVEPPEKAEETIEPEILRRLPEILPSEPAPWGVGSGETPVAQLRALGTLPEALVNFLALLGWRPPEGTSDVLTLAQLLRVFTPEQIVPTPVRFDAAKLRGLNRYWLQQAELNRLLELSLPYFCAAGYIPEDPPEPMRQWLKDLIRAVLPGLDYLALLPQRTRLIFCYSAQTCLEFPESRLALEREGARDVIREFGQRVLELSTGSRGDSWMTTTRLEAIIAQVKTATRWKGRNLLEPLRVVLTGLPFGPELEQLVAIFEQGSRFQLPVHVKSCRERVLEFCSVFV